jgi:hypothetical protein
MLNGNSLVTNAGNPKAPPIEEVLTWVQQAWNELVPELIRKSFLACGISNALDGSENDQIHFF